MGIRLKSEAFPKDNGVPGPGAYSDSPAIRKTPMHKFGKSKRPEPSGPLSLVPGPGHYRLHTKIAPLPEYALPAVKK